MNGKKATTHWYRAEEMMNRYGAAYKQARYINDGKYWTSAGVSAGIDMSLALIKNITGEQYMQKVMLDLAYDPQSPINAGTPEKSDKNVFQMMQTMYDYGMLPLIKKDDKKKNKHKTL